MKPFNLHSSENAARGYQAKSAGDAFEGWIDVQHLKALRLGILAHIVHNQAQTSVKGGRLIYTGKGVADYTGVLDRVGLAFAAEAKSTKTDRLKRSAIDTKQADHLSAVARAGGLALLLAEFRHEDLPIRHAIPWLEVPWVILRSAESVDCNALARWRIPRDPEICYLEQFHARGEPSTPRRSYPRE